MNNEIIIQITSGRGPAECCWVVSQVLKTILQEAEKKRFYTEVISRTPGMEAGTIVSAVIKLQGATVAGFAQEWIGTVLWVGQSPYRKFHKRKNWYVGVNVVDAGEAHHWDEKDINYQTLRASGPGGQHVNKTETAVRAIHVPTGIQVTASDNRSQLQNKKLATTRLQDKLAAWRFADLLKKEQSQWNQHNLLERGNPVKVFRGRDFVVAALEVFCAMVLML